MTITSSIYATPITSVSAVLYSAVERDTHSQVKTHGIWDIIERTIALLYNPFLSCLVVLLFLSHRPIVVPPLPPMTLSDTSSSDHGVVPPPPMFFPQLVTTMPNTTATPPEFSATPSFDAADIAEQQAQCQYYVVPSSNVPPGAQIQMMPFAMQQHSSMMPQAHPNVVVVQQYNPSDSRDLGIAVMFFLLGFLFPILWLCTFQYVALTHTYHELCCLTRVSNYHHYYHHHHHGLASWC
jgi:hypothetical protein